ncbi:hypothetical protein ABFS83_04G093300 [Erythranthe nasuta]
MGNQKLKWTAEEEETLRAGVGKHGTGKWKNILLDPEFKEKLSNRSNVDLKDKWRNLSVSGGFGASSATPRGKATVTNVVTPMTEISPSVFVSKETVNDRLPHSPPNVDNALTDKMVLEALSSMKDCDGSDCDAIMGFVENKYNVPQSSRRLISSKLRKLLLQGTIEKVPKGYKIKEAETGTKTPTPQQHDVRSRPRQDSTPTIIVDTVEEAAKIAADLIAEAEYKSLLAAEAVKEAEKLSLIADNADVLLRSLKEILDEWDDKGNNTSSKS